MKKSNLNTKQTEELAKILINLGHLVFGSLVLKIVEQNDNTLSIIIIPFGFMISIYAYWIGIKFLKHINDGQS